MVWDMARLTKADKALFADTSSPWGKGGLAPRRIPKNQYYIEKIKDNRGKEFHLVYRTIPERQSVLDRLRVNDVSGMGQYDYESEYIREEIYSRVYFVAPEYKDQFPAYEPVVHHGKK